MTWTCSDCGHENCEHSQPRERAALEWRKDPMASTRTIADRANVSQRTAVRAKPIEPHGSIQRKNGGTYPASREPHRPAVSLDGKKISSAHAIFLLRVDQAIALAVVDCAPTPDFVNYARRVSTVWNEFANQMEKQLGAGE